MTSGSEGGMLLTNNEKFAVNARKFGGIGYKHMTAKAGRTSLALSSVQDPNYERFDTVGLNYRMPEICAAVGLAQFERIEEIVTKRQKVARLFSHAVIDCNWIKPQLIPIDYLHSHYTFSFEFLGLEKFGMTWKDFYNLYTEAGGDGFYSACVVPYLEPVFKNSNNKKLKLISTLNHCPVAEDLQKKIMQFKTNYRSLEEAENKANILKKVIDKIGRVK